MLKNVENFCYKMGMLNFAFKLSQSSGIALEYVQLYSYGKHKVS